MHGSVSQIDWLWTVGLDFSTGVGWHFGKLVRGIVHSKTRERHVNYTTGDTIVRHRLDIDHEYKVKITFA